MLKRIFNALGLIIMLVVGILMFMASCTGFWIGHTVSAGNGTMNNINQHQELIVENEPPL